MKKIFLILFLACSLALVLFFLSRTENLINKEDSQSDESLKDFVTIDYGGIKVDVLIDWPEEETKDVLLAFHGTTMNDSEIIPAARIMKEKTRGIIERKDLMIISVAYPQENLLIGDNIKEAEAVLLWVKDNAEEELGIEFEKIYMFGHSQGGYLATRLNTMHKTAGVIANAPGPINLLFRCSVAERNNSKREEIACSSIREKYGSVFDNPEAYLDRSLISFVSKHKSKILFIQGLEDIKIQIKLWQELKNGISQCQNCAEFIFLEIEGTEHNAAFEDDRAKEAINIFFN